MKSKKSQAVIVKMMLAILIFIFAIIVFKPTQQNIEYATNSTSLNCSSPTLTVANDAVCEFMEVGLLFYYIAILIAVSMALIQGKKTVMGIIETITVFMITIILITPLKQLIVLFRDTSHLSCGTAGISLAANMLCIFVDLWLFYFIVISIAVAATYTYHKVVNKDE